MFGGAAPKFNGLNPADIEIRSNTFYKPLAWREGDPRYEGTHWSVKNLFELKIGERVLVEGNTFEQTWADARTPIRSSFTRLSLRSTTSIRCQRTAGGGLSRSAVRATSKRKPK